MNQFRRNSKRALVGILGGLVVLVGLILVPYPGPGWLVVFAGLAILATEFAFAAKALEFAKGKYDAWVEWLKVQSWLVRIAVLALTSVVVIVTIWLVNGFGIAAGVFNLQYEWLTSPLFR